MSGLPSAEPQTPTCGACHGDTRFDGDVFYCEDCELAFSPDDLSAAFLNPDAAVCGAECDNFWHGDNRIQQGRGYKCHPCQLPTGHPSRMHWTGCVPVRVEAVTL